MRIAETKPLFAWDCLEDSPSLRTVRQFLEAIPDGPLLEGLRRQRGRGRNDYPVHVLWGVVVLTVALRHQSTEACLAELKRNEALRRLAMNRALGYVAQGGSPEPGFKIFDKNCSICHQVGGKGAVVGPQREP